MTDKIIVNKNGGGFGCACIILAICICCYMKEILELIKTFAK